VCKEGRYTTSHSSGRDRARATEFRRQTHTSMTTELKPEVARGRRQLLLVVAAITVPPLGAALAVVFLGLAVDRGAIVVPILLSAAIGVCLLRGYSWARYYLGLAFCLNAVLRFFGSLVILTSLPGLVGLLLSICYGVGAWALLKSAPIDAYFEYRRRQREPVFSLRGDDGV